MTLSSIEMAAAAELAQRKSMAISLFRPLVNQEPIFEQPRPKFMLVTGGNRGGKTISLLELSAAFALDMPITFKDGSQHEARMPWQKGRPVVIWMVCIDSRHIGDVIYKGLFSSGFFKRWFVARDPKTMKLRNFEEADEAAGVKKYPHPPLIPKRYIDGDFAWDTKATGVFKSVSLKDPATGEPLAEIHAFTSKSDCPQGRVADFILVEEQLARDGFIGELMMRLADVRGQLLWSSWAADEGEDSDLAKFEAMVNKEIELKSGFAKKISLAQSDNTTFTKEMIEENLRGLSPEEREQRDKGVRPSEKLRMYPLFNKKTHSALDYDDELANVLRERDGIPPDDWTRTLVLDPGTQHPAVLLCAVPPPRFGDYVVPYQEVYPGRADPKQLAAASKASMHGQVFHRFIIDHRAGRQQTMGMASGVRVVDAYSRAFEEENLSCVTTRSAFLFGSDNVGGRQLVLQGWLHPTKVGPPKLRIVTHRCPQLCAQLSKVNKKVVSKEVVDERKAAGQPSDIIDCYDAMTEVLTRHDGWRKFSELSGEEELATMNLSSRKMEFQKPTKLIAKQYDGDMTRIKSRRVDMLVTPGHRMVTVHSTGKIRIRESRELLPSVDRIPLSCEGGYDGVMPRVIIPRQFRGHKQVDEITDVASFAEFFGWWMSEGCCVKYRKIGRGYHTVISQKKAHGKALIENCLSKIPFHYTKDENPEGSCNYLISHMQLWYYMKQFGDVRTKQVPHWIKDGTTEIRQRFLDAYIAGDGWHQSGKWASASVSPQLSDDIQEIAAKLGMWTSGRTHKKRSSVGVGGRPFHAKSDQHHVSLGVKSPLATLYRHTGGYKSMVSTEHYSGMVYCASVPNTTLVVRRNKKVAVCGNCLEYFAASGPRFVYVAPRIEDASSAYRRYMKRFGGSKPSSVKLTF